MSAWHEPHGVCAWTAADFSLPVGSGGSGVAANFAWAFAGGVPRTSQKRRLRRKRPRNTYDVSPECARAAIMAGWVMSPLYWLASSDTSCHEPAAGAETPKN